MSRVMLAMAISYAVEIMVWIVIIDAVLTFIPSIDRRHPIVMLLRGITQPIYRQVRRVIPTVRMGEVGLDLSPIIVIIGLQIIGQIIRQILRII